MRTVNHWTWWTQDGGTRAAPRGARPVRLGGRAEQFGAEPDRVAADVEQRAALKVAGVPDVPRPGEREMEVGLDLHQLADRAVRDQGHDPLELRVERERERLPEQRAGPAGGREHALGIGQRAAERLLAQHRLARIERADRP